MRGLIAALICEARIQRKRSSLQNENEGEA